MSGPSAAGLMTHIRELAERGLRLQQELREFKSRTAVPDYGWYPYESLTGVPVVTGVMGGLPAEALRGPVADLGCGDGDWSILLAQGGAEVDAVDHRESNFNQMRGVEILRRAYAPAVAPIDLDLDGPFHLPRRDYSLILFLGTLYHLKNPYYVLETLAAAGDWCVVSTRIAQCSPRGVRIEEEPVAYLLDRREANNDPTNFWIFSHAGLVRLLQRAGWMVAASQRVGCTTDSDPVRADTDERIFLLLHSRVRNPELFVAPRDGWHAIESGWRWTAKRFTLDVALPMAHSTAEFALRFTVPQVVIDAGSPVRLVCRSGDAELGAISCDAAETIEFRGRFPKDSQPGARLLLEFTVESRFAAPGDSRDLGVIVPVIESAHTHGVPFRIS